MGFGTRMHSRIYRNCQTQPISVTAVFWLLNCTCHLQSTAFSLRDATSRSALLFSGLGTQTGVERPVNYLFLLIKYLNNQVDAHTILRV